VQRADEVTQFCQLVHADDAVPDGNSTLTDHGGQDATSSKITTNQRLNKVLAELVATEQQYVKVKLFFVYEVHKTRRDRSDSIETFKW